MGDATGAVDPHEEERIRIINRLKRLEGQIRGLQSMVEAEKECEAILTQVMAAKSALNRVGLHIIGHAMKTCMAREGASRDEIVDEAMEIFLKYATFGERA